MKWKVEVSLMSNQEVHPSSRHTSKWLFEAIILGLDFFPVKSGKWIEGFWGSCSFSLCISAWVHAQSLSCVWLSVSPWTVVRQAPLSLGFPRQGCCSGFPFPSPGIFPTQESNLCLLHCRQILSPLSHLGSPCISEILFNIHWLQSYSAKENEQLPTNVVKVLL